MPTYVMLTRLEHNSVEQPGNLQHLERKVMDRIHEDCPDVTWASSYAVLGPYDYLDVFDAPDHETATKVSTIIRTYGHAQTEVWGATQWDKFKDLVQSIAH